MIDIFRMAGECNGHLVFLLFNDRHSAKEDKEYAGYFAFLFLLTCCRSCRQCVFNFKKKILAWIKANLLRTLSMLPKTQNLNWLHHVTLKIYSLQNPPGTVSGNSFEEFKAIRHCLYFAHISDFFSKKRFLRKSSKSGRGNLVLITSTVQVELSKLNFNFDDIRTYFLQVLRDVDK